MSHSAAQSGGSARAAAAAAPRPERSSAWALDAAELEARLNLQRAADGGGDDEPVEGPGTERRDQENVTKSTEV